MGTGLRERKPDFQKGKCNSQAREEGKKGKGRSSRPQVTVTSSSRGSNRGSAISEQPAALQAAGWGPTGAAVQGWRRMLCGAGFLAPPEDQCCRGVAFKVRQGSVLIENSGRVRPVDGVGEVCVGLPVPSRKHGRGSRNACSTVRGTYRVL